MEQLQALLSHIAGACTDGPRGDCYALVDGALVPDAWRWAQGKVPCAGLTPSHVTANADDQWALPFLMLLSPTHLAPGSAVLRKTVKWALEADAATWLLSPTSLGELARGLSERLLLALPEDLSAVVRFADARVLPVLDSVLKPEQAMAFFEGIAAWWYLDRSGRLTPLRLAVPADPCGRSMKPAELPLRLDIAQESAMLQAAELDSVVSLLLEHDARAVAMDRAQRYRFVACQAEMAREWNIKSTLDVALFCMASLALGDGFAKAPEWQLALGDVGAGRRTLSQVLEAAA